MRTLIPYDNFLNEEESDYPKKFEDLPEEVQKKAIEKNSDINVDYDGWHDFAIESFKESLKNEHAVFDVEVSYSGFWSQGDGASFTSDNVSSEDFLKSIGVKSNLVFDMGDNQEMEDELEDLVKGLEDLGYDGTIRMKPENIIIKFERGSSNYAHENTVSTDMEEDDIPENWNSKQTEAWANFISSLEDKIEDWRKDKCRELYRGLEKEYDVLTSEEQIKETLVANDYSFDEEGKIS